MNLNQPRYLHIEGLLSSEEVELIRQITASANFKDGKVSASDAAKQVKQNLQIRAEDDLHAQQAGNVMMQAMSRNVTIQGAIMPKAILPPLFTRYTESMNYGMHVDSPLMGTQFTIRTDVGMTLFLSDPDDYEGGELLILTETGEHKYKLPAGDAIIYPTTKLHQVLPVTSGERMAAITWMQCAVRDAHQRDLLYTLTKATGNLAQKGLKDEHLAIQQVYANLVRMWAEL